MTLESNHIFLSAVRHVFDQGIDILMDAPALTTLLLGVLGKPAAFK